MKVLCGWCSKYLGEKEVQGSDEPTHGICDHCLNINFPHHADRIRAALEVEKVEDIYKAGKEVRK